MCFECLIGKIPSRNVFFGNIRIDNISKILFEVVISVIIFPVISCANHVIFRGVGSELGEHFVCIRQVGDDSGFLSFRSF